MKKNLLLITCFVFALVKSVHAQAPQVEWQKSYGGNTEDRAHCIKQTFDGGYIVIGKTVSDDGDVSGNHGYYDYWIVKLNSSGIIQWQKCLGNGGLQEGISIDQTIDGGYIAAGNTSSPDLGDVTGTHGDRDFWIVKLDAIGDVVGTGKCFGGSYGDYPAAIKQTTDGGYIVAGNTQSYNSGDVVGGYGSGDAWIVKLYPSLDKEWTSCIGGSRKDAASAVEEILDNMGKSTGYIVVGFTSSNDGVIPPTQGVQAGNDYWVVKLDLTGKIIPTQNHRFGGSGDDQATSVIQTVDGNYLVAGFTRSNDGDVPAIQNPNGSDYWVIKLDQTTGKIIANQTYHFGGTGDDRLNSVDQTTDGGFIVAGVDGAGKGSIIKLKNDLSSNPVIEWESPDVTIEELSSVKQTSDGGYIAADIDGRKFGVVKLLGPNGPATALETSNNSITVTIPGNSAIDINNVNNEKLIRLAPTRGENALSGSVTTSVTINNNLPTVNEPYVQRYYDITPAGNANMAKATITLYFTQGEFDGFNDFSTANPSLGLPLLPTNGVDNGKVRIKQFHGTFNSTSDPSQNITPNVVWDVSKSWWIVTFPVSGFSRFYLTTGINVLPLTLLEFKGMLQNDAVNLQWSTTDEVNTSEFIIERSSQNNSYTGLGKVPAQSTAGNHQYGFIDTRPLAGNNFYRLKMIDKDGHSTYSHIVPVKINDAVFKLSAYPSPAKNILNIKISSTGNNIITVLVTDLSGKLVLKKVTNTVNGESVIPLNVSRLSAGHYFLKILSANGKENVVKKFVKL